MISNKFLNGPNTGKETRMGEWIVIPILFLFFQFLTLSGITIVTSRLEQASLAFGVELLVGCGVPSLLLFYFVKKIKKWEVGTLGFYKNQVLKKYSIGVGIAFFSLTTIIGVLVITKQMVLQFNPVDIGMDSIAVGTLIVLGWVVQGASEEMLLRGYLLPSIASKNGWYKGLILSSMIFAFLHLGNNGVTILSLLNILLCGVALGLLCMVEEGIWSACGFHACWNLMQGNVYGIPVSGLSNQTSIWNATLNAPTMWNGGRFGIEGSFLTTIFFIVFITVLVVLFNRKE